MILIILLNTHELPLGAREKKLSRALENPSPILLVRKRSGHGQRAGHSRKQGDRFPAPFLLGPGWDVLRHPADVRSEGLQEWSACATGPSGHLGRECSHGTTAGDIVAVPDIEVGVDQRSQFAARRRTFDRSSHPVPDFLEAVLERFRKEPLFAVEMTIEAPVCQTEIAHEIADAGTLTPSAAEAARCRSNYSVACLLFVAGGVTHSQLQ